MTNDIRKVVLYNRFGNGDVHYSKEFVRDIANRLKPQGIECFVSHRQHPTIISDLGLPFIQAKDLPHWVEDRGPLYRYGDGSDTLFVNTWIGQRSGHWGKRAGEAYFVGGTKMLTDHEGCTLRNNHAMFADIYKAVGLGQLNEELTYIPRHDYASQFRNKELLRNKLNVLVCNGPVLSAQAANFSFDGAIRKLAGENPDVGFFTTVRINGPINVHDANDVAGADQGSSLNRIGRLSTACDVVVHRCSGPGCLTHNTDNLLCDKVMVGFGYNTREIHWATMTDYDARVKAHQLWADARSDDSPSITHLIQEAIELSGARR